MGRKKMNPLTKIIKKFWNKYNKIQFTFVAEHEVCSINLWNEEPSDWGGQAVQTSFEQKSLSPFIKEMFKWKKHERYFGDDNFHLNKKEIKALKECFEEFNYEIENYNCDIKKVPETYIWLRMPITNETLETKLIELSEVYKNKLNESN